MTLRQSTSPRSMSAQLTVMGILVALLPLACLGILTVVFYDAAYREKTNALLGEQVMRNAQSLDAFLEERLADLRHEAKISTPEQLSSSDYLQSRLHLMQSVHAGIYTDLDFFDAQGTLLARAPHSATGTAEPGPAWVSQALSRPFHIDITGPGHRPLFFLTVRIATAHNIWLLRARMDPALLAERLRAFHPGGRGTAFLLDPDAANETSSANPPLFAQARSVLQHQVFPENTPLVLCAFDQIFAGFPLKNTGAFLVFQQAEAEASAPLWTARITGGLIVLVGLVGIIATITAMGRRMEQRLRTAEHAQRQMQQQVVEAGKLAAIGELAAGIAHEINNPLAIMMENSGWVQDLLNSDDFQSEENMEEIHTSLQTIVTQGHRCKEITRKLLSFARKTDNSGQAPINALLQDVAGFARQKARHNNVTIELDLDPEVPDIQASPTEIQQVALNLVNNAIDAINNDDGRVRIASARTADGVTIAITDNGEGIPEEKRGQIFEPFFTTKPAGKGTGLGLSICRDIVTRMGGNISVTSTVGQGSTFTVTLPWTGRP